MSEKRGGVDSRSELLFPVLTETELHQVRDYGIVRQHLAGATVVAAGAQTDGLLFLLSGTVSVIVHGSSGDASQVATYGPGAFVGELGDLSGRASAVTVKSQDPLTTLAVSAEGLHALLKARTGVGERIARALILRHLGLVEIERVIVIGRRLSRNAVRVDRFMHQNGHLMQRLDPAIDETARSLIERLKLGEAEFPIVLSPNGRLMCNPTDVELAFALAAD
jgi:thioredoxin reductase (NADPH)